MTLESQVAAEIRARLARRRMQQAELAALVGEHPSWVSRRLSETRRITIDDLERIAKALGVGAVDLLPRSARTGTSVIQPYLEQPESPSPVKPNERSGSGEASRRSSGRRVRRLKVHSAVPDALSVAA